MASPDGRKSACLSTWVIEELWNRMLCIIGSALLWLDSIFVLLMDERTEKKNTRHENKPQCRLEANKGSSQ